MTAERPSVLPVLARGLAEIGDKVESWNLEILVDVDDYVLAQREALEAMLAFLVPVLPSDKAGNPLALRSEFGNARGFRRHVTLDVYQDATVGFFMSAPSSGESARVPKPGSEAEATDFLKFQHRWLSGLLAAEILETLARLPDA